MPKITNTTLKAEVARLCAPKDWDKDTWSNEDMAVAVVRTVLIEMGCKESMEDSFAADRWELVQAIKRVFTAPVNYQRDYLVEEKLAPEKAKVEKAKTASALA